MPEITVKFHRCHQDSQEYGSDDEHMVSRVFFSLEVDGKPKGEFYTDLKLVVGDDFETGAIEVGPPVGYEGPFSHVQFTNAVTAYFRSLVGSRGSGIHIEGGRNIRMRNNQFVQETEVRFTTR